MKDFRQGIIHFSFSIFYWEIMAKKKFYTVWKGVNPGVYASWTDCQLQVKNYQGAVFKSFDTREEAERAFSMPAHLIFSARKTENAGLSLPEGFNRNCLVVDAACSGNPGPMEYRGVYLLTGQEVFHFGPVYGTNNIGEFLAIVHGLALLKKKNLDMPVYSDSRNALLWVKQKRCKTKLERNARTEELFSLIERAENWLKENAYKTPLLKWETERWGEIPADFGRK